MGEQKGTPVARTSSRDDRAKEVHVTRLDLLRDGRTNNESSRHEVGDHPSTKVVPAGFLIPA